MLVVVVVLPLEDELPEPDDGDEPTTDPVGICGLSGCVIGLNIGACPVGS